MEQLTSAQSGFVLTLTEIIGDYGAKIDSPVLAYGSYLTLAHELRIMLRDKPLSLVNAYW